MCGPQIPHDPTKMDVRAPAAKDQDGPLTTENGPMKGVPANESATAVCQDGWKGDCHGRAHFHIGPPVGQGRIQGPAYRGRQFEEFDL